MGSAPPAESRACQHAVTTAPARGDDIATIAILMYKAVKRGCTKEGSPKNFHSGEKGTVCSYAQRATSPWDTSHLCSAIPPSWLDGGLF